MRRRSFLALIFTALSCSGALADTCKTQASEKKLAGAAFNSFMKKCELDAASMCDTQAADKKLSGAAKVKLHQEVREGRDRHLVV